MSLHTNAVSFGKSWRSSNAQPEMPGSPQGWRGEDNSCREAGKSLNERSMEEFTSRQVLDADTLASEGPVLSSVEGLLTWRFCKRPDKTRGIPSAVLQIRGHHPRVRGSDRQEYQVVPRLMQKCKPLDVDVAWVLTLVVRVWQKLQGCALMGVTGVGSCRLVGLKVLPLRWVLQAGAATFGVEGWS